MVKLVRINIRVILLVFVIFVKCSRLLIVLIDIKFCVNMFVVINNMIMFLKVFVMFL